MIRGGRRCVKLSVMNKSIILKYYRILRLTHMGQSFNNGTFAWILQSYYECVECSSVLHSYSSSKIQHSTASTCADKLYWCSGTPLDWHSSRLTWLALWSCSTGTLWPHWVNAAHDLPPHKLNTAWCRWANEAISFSPTGSLPLHREATPALAWPGCTAEL